MLLWLETPLRLWSSNNRDRKIHFGGMGGMQALLPLQVAYFVFYRKPFKVLTYGFASDIGGV